MNEATLPVIDVQPLISGGDASGVAEAFYAACSEFGFFYITGHGVPSRLQQRLEDRSREFFEQDLATKNAIRMELGGRAWRGYFPVGDELTSGKPDQKEGLYFGNELPADHPSVRAGVPLHGANLFPAVPDFRECVLEYIDAMTTLGHQLMSGIALSLGLDAGYFDTRYTSDPLVLFRIFHYPPLEEEDQEMWSVGEHTDYGLLTILRQDQAGGLQIRAQSEWIDAPVIEDSFVCNIGDMLDRMTGGLYRSTPHRVRNRARVGRLSFPFFFDPGWDAQVQPIRTPAAGEDDAATRWDNASVHDWSGTYGQYILSKVARVFPDLHESL